MKSQYSHVGHMLANTSLVANTRSRGEPFLLAGLPYGLGM